MDTAANRFFRIDEKKARLDKARPLPAQTVQSLRENMIIEWTYHSNAIEGNTLSMAETRVVLEGITVGGKSLREHLEAVNHRDAIVYLEELVRGNEPVSQWSIRGLHRLVLKGIDDDNAGVYRKANVLIGGARHRPPEHMLVKERMEAMMASYDGEWQSLHTIERAAQLHGEFVGIHPFIDGNGRTARLLMNFELMRSGYPPTVIRQEIRPQYYETLDWAHTAQDYVPFYELISEAVESSLDLWLSLL